MKTQMTLSAVTLGLLLSACGDSSNQNQTDAPIVEEALLAQNDFAETVNGAALDVDVMANDMGGNFSLRSVGTHSAGMFSITDDARIRIDMNDDFAGRLSIPYTIENANGDVSEGQLAIDAFQAQTVNGTVAYGVGATSNQDFSGQVISVNSDQYRVKADPSGQFEVLVRTLDVNSPVSFTAELTTASANALTLTYLAESFQALRDNATVSLDAIGTAHGILKKELIANKTASVSEISANQLFETAAALEYLGQSESFELGASYDNINAFVSDTSAYNAYFTEVANDPAAKSNYAASHEAVVSYSANKVKLGRINIADTFYLVRDLLPGGINYGASKYDLEASYDGTFTNEKVKLTFDWVKSNGNIRLLYDQGPDNLSEPRVRFIDNTIASQEQIDLIIEYGGDLCCVESRTALVAEEIALIARVEGKNIVNVVSTSMTTYDPIELERTREVEVIGEDGEVSFETVVERETVILSPSVNVFDNRSMLINDNQTHVATFASDMLSERTWVLPRILSEAPLLPVYNEAFHYGDEFTFLPDGRGAISGANGYAAAIDFGWQINDDRQLIIDYYNGIKQSYRVYGETEAGFNVITEEFDDRGQITSVTAGLAMEKAAGAAFDMTWLAASSPEQYWQTSINIFNPDAYIDGVLPLTSRFGWEFFNDGTGNSLTWNWAGLNDPEFEYGERVANAYPLTWTMPESGKLFFEYHRSRNPDEVVESSCGKTVCYSRDWSVVSVNSTNDSFFVLEKSAISINGGEFETYIAPRLVNYTLWDKPKVDGESGGESATRRLFLTGPASNSSQEQ